MKSHVYRTILILSVCFVSFTCEQNKSSYSENSNLGIEYKPTGLPFKISFSSDGINVEADLNTIVTPIGTFTLKYGQKLVEKRQINDNNIDRDYFNKNYEVEGAKMEYPKDKSSVTINKTDMIIFVKNSQSNNKYDIFKISDDNRDFVINFNNASGKIKFNNKNNWIIIEFNDGGITLEDKSKYLADNLSEEEIRNLIDNTQLSDSDESKVLSKKEYKEKIKGIRRIKSISKSEKKNLIKALRRKKKRARNNK